MESTPGKRLQEWREFKGLSLTEVFRLTGVKVTTLSTAEQPGGSNPSYDTITKLLGAFPDLNPDWLLLGTGPMLRDGRALTPVTTSAPDPDPPMPASPVMLSIPTLAEMSAEERAHYWQVRWEDAARKLAVYTQAEEHEKTVKLMRSTGGKSFTEASADAADPLPTAPTVMVLSFVNPDKQAAEEFRRRRAHAPVAVPYFARPVVVGFTASR